MFEAFGPQHLLPLLRGAVLTVVLCAASGAVGVVLGFILGLARTSPSRVARIVSATYVGAIRGVPLLVLIFIVYFGLPLLIPEWDVSSFLTAVVALSVYSAAYVAEIVRGSIEAIPRGQAEAADALGLRYGLKYRYVIMPQAMRIAVPPGIGFLIALVKDSSLVTVVGLVELSRAGSVVSSRTADPITTFLAVAAIYFAICYPISLLGRLYERRKNISSNPIRLQQPLGFRRGRPT